jgi:hypothetical protein
MIQNLFSRAGRASKKRVAQYFVLVLMISLPTLSQAQVVIQDIKCPMGASCSEIYSDLYEKIKKHYRSEINSINTSDCKSLTWEVKSSFELLSLLNSKALDHAQYLRPVVIRSGARPTDPVFVALETTVNILKNTALSAASLRLDVADLALKSKCFDIADENYRYVVKNYSSDLFSGLRQRAQIGIDDVRSARD